MQPDAPLEVIRASYKTLMRELEQHPDLGGDLWNAQVINEAYSTLSDRGKRQAYDADLFRRYTKKPLRDPLTDAPPLITLYCPFCKRPLARRAEPGETCPTCKTLLHSVEKRAGADSRSQVRIKKKDAFYFYTTWPQKRKLGQLIDFSRQGLRFNCDEHLLPDMLIKISGALMQGVARVKNVHKIFAGKGRKYSVGAEFVSVEFPDQKGTFYSSTG